MAVLTVFFILLVDLKSCASLQAIVNSFKIHGASNRIMPEQVIAKLTTADNVTVDLKLRPIPHLNVALPVEFISVDEDDRLVTTAEHINPSNDVSYYQDDHYKAAIQLTRYWDKTNELFGYNMRGHVIFHDSIYYIDSETDNANQSEARYQFLTLLPKEPPVQIVSLEGRQINLVMEMPVQGLKCQEHFTANATGGDNHGEKGIPLRHTNQSRHSRNYDEYFIDIIGIVDYGLYLKFKDSLPEPFPLTLNEHFSYLFNEVDLLYKNLGSKYTINVRLNKLLVSKNEKAAFFTESIVNKRLVHATRSIKILQQFTSTKAKAFLKESDHLMVFTSYDLFTYTNVTTGVINKAIVGVANNGAMCRKDGTSCSIIELHNNGFMVVTNIAHEIGHSLSATHDGTGNNCEANDRHIMAASISKETPGTVLNPFRFSRCSVDNFSNLINSLLPTPNGHDCLTNFYPRSHNIPEVSGRLIGLDMSADEQCEGLRGRGSFFCRHMILEASMVCTNLWCSDPMNTSFCRVYLPHSGTTCGNKKICLFGRCEEDPRAPEVQEMCVFGEPPSVIVSGKTCEELIHDTVSYCYSNYLVSKLCCGSCGKHYRPIRGCEYGDQFTNCTQEDCGMYAKYCCTTCNFGVPMTTKKRTIEHFPHGVHHVSKLKSQETTTTSKRKHIFTTINEPMIVNQWITIKNTKKTTRKTTKRYRKMTNRIVTQKDIVQMATSRAAVQEWFIPVSTLYIVFKVYASIIHSR